MNNNFNFGTVNDNDESLVSKGTSGVFGLNQNVYITKIAFNPDGGRQGEGTHCCDINIMIDGKEFMRRIFDVTRVFGKNGEITDTTSEEYQKEYTNTMKQNLAVITHAVKAVGVTDDQIKAIFTQPVSSFGEWVQRITSLLPQNYQTIPVDVFLEYQWTISPEQSMTFLEIPRNMKGGKFLSPHINPVGGFKEEREWMENGIKHSGLRYVDNAGNVHPFTRNSSYMESNKAIQQRDDDNNNGSNAGQSALNNIMQSNQTTAKRSVW